MVLPEILTLASISGVALRTRTVEDYARIRTHSRRSRNVVCCRGIAGVSRAIIELRMSCVRYRERAINSAGAPVERSHCMLVRMDWCLMAEMGYGIVIGDQPEAVAIVRMIMVVVIMMLAHVRVRSVGRYCISVSEAAVRGWFSCYRCLRPSCVFTNINIIVFL